MPTLQRMGHPQRENPRADDNDRHETQLHLELPDAPPDGDRRFTGMKKTNSHLLLWGLSNVREEV